MRKRMLQLKALPAVGISVLPKPILRSSASAGDPTRVVSSSSRAGAAPSSLRPRWSSRSPPPPPPSAPILGQPLPEARFHQHRPAPPLVIDNEQDTRGGVVPLRCAQTPLRPEHFRRRALSTPSAARATPTSGRRTLARLVDLERPPLQLLPIQLGDGLRHVAVQLHLDEAEAPGLSGDAVRDDVGGKALPDLREQRLQVRARGVGGEVPSTLLAHRPRRVACGYPVARG